MALFAEGAPCWADAVLPDVEAGKRFYGPLFDWTFEEEAVSGARYAQALHDGRHVATLVPKVDGRMPTVWNIYFAARDATAAAARVVRAGGQIIVPVGEVGSAGRLMMAADPAGAVFGVWQATGHPGFEERDAPGSFCWVELFTRDSAAVDPFYRSVFGYRTRQIGQAGGDFDYEVWIPQGSPGAPGGEPVAGRVEMKAGLPAALPPHFLLYFRVADCDAAAESVRRLGGRVDSGPRDSAFGRFATVVDDQGAHFAVIDTSRAAGADGV